MFFYIVLTPISTTSGLRSTGNTRKYHQIDVYIYQCDTWYRQNVLYFLAEKITQERLAWSSGFDETRKICHSMVCPMAGDTNRSKLKSTAKTSSLCE